MQPVTFAVAGAVLLGLCLACVAGTVWCLRELWRRAKGGER